MNNDRPTKISLNLSRRQFLLLTAGVGAITGCQTEGDTGNPAIPTAEHLVNAGPVARYGTDGVYGGFREEGFFVIRKGEKLVVVSAICTHKKCKLAAEPDHSFYCKCHGSTFDPDGRVTNGPAKRDLPIFSTSVNEQGQLLVKVPGR